MSLPPLPGRRQFLQGLGATVGISLLPASLHASSPPKGSFVYCLNMSTIRGHHLGFVRELEVASRAASVQWKSGWTPQKFLDGGGTIADARKRINDLGLKVENAIGFAQWIVDDDATRTKGIEQLKREMEMLAQLGCSRTAAPPTGATQAPGLDLKRAAERYRAILELGEKTGVMPQLELWAFPKPQPPERSAVRGHRKRPPVGPDAARRITLQGWFQPRQPAPRGQRRH